MGHVLRVREVTVRRATSAVLSLLVRVPAGPSTVWSAAVAMRSLLMRVECTSRRRLPIVRFSSDSRGDSRTAAVRGSPETAGSCSLAMSSDWTTTRTGASTASTS